MKNWLCRSINNVNIIMRVKVYLKNISLKGRVIHQCLCYDISEDLFHRLYVWVKKWVFKCFLKDSKVEHDLRCSGRLFHCFGPYTENALSAMQDLVRDTSSIFLLLDLRFRCGACCLRRSCRYVGDFPDWHLKTWHSTLKSTLSLIGSQCRFLSIGVMCSRLFVRLTILAAWFWTFWSLSIEFWGSNRIVVMNCSSLGDSWQKYLQEAVRCLCLYNLLFYQYF